MMKPKHKLCCFHITSRSAVSVFFCFFTVYSPILLPLLSLSLSPLPLPIYSRVNAFLQYPPPGKASTIQADCTPYLFYFSLFPSVEQPSRGCSVSFFPPEIQAINAPPSHVIPNSDALSLLPTLTSPHPTILLPSFSVSSPPPFPLFRFVHSNDCPTVSSTLLFHEPCSCEERKEKGEDKGGYWRWLRQEKMGIDRYCHCVEEGELQTLSF